MENTLGGCPYQQRGRGGGVWFSYKSCLYVITRQKCKTNTLSVHCAACRQIWSDKQEPGALNFCFHVFYLHEHFHQPGIPHRTPATKWYGIVYPNITKGFLWAVTHTDSWFTCLGLISRLRWALSKDEAERCWKQLEFFFFFSSQLRCCLFPSCAAYFAGLRNETSSTSSK